MNKLLPKKCHFIGIGGIGMSGLARILLKQGIAVSGSDQSENYSTKRLAEQGAQISLGHSAAHIDPAATVVFSSSIAKDNVEMIQAQELGCSVIHRSELLGLLMSARKALAVAGTHGKTTTSALLSTVLKKAEMNPSFMVGGILAQYEANADAGDGEFFVAEADESDGTFLSYNPYGAIITNIGNDHLDHYGSQKELLRCFYNFSQKVISTNHFFWCGDDPHLRSMELEGISYGFSSDCALRILRFKQEGWQCRFDAAYKGKVYADIVLSLPGKHNALNGAAVFGLALSLGCGEEAVREALREFQGVQRRCEKKGEVSKILFLDDYAHHPTEIKATLSAIRQAVGERRLIAIFQPHRYSRMKHCMGELKDSFNEADKVWVTEVYSAGEPPLEGISHETIATEIPRSLPALQEDLCKRLYEDLRPHDVVVTLGAGNITRFGSEMLKFLETRPPKKLSVGVIGGGASYEHEVSLVSAEFVAKSLSKELYDVSVYEIAKDGHFSLDDWSRCDLFFPVLHGPYGEDGTIQGLFEMLQMPYVGCGHRSSALAMDKALTKELALLNGIRTLPFISISQYDWKDSRELLIEKISQELLFPVFVKGLHLGSSVAVIKVETLRDLPSAIDKVLAFDTGLIVEQGIEGREIEFAVLGCGNIEVFPPGEILSYGQVYDYSAKYGVDGLGTTCEPDLMDEQVALGCALAERAYRAIGGDGMARVDFFLDQNGKFWLNEINPIPGMTKISLFPQLCQKHRYSHEELMDRLIILALYRFRQSQRVGYGTKV